MALDKEKVEISDQYDESTQKGDPNAKPPKEIDDNDENPDDFADLISDEDVLDEEEITGDDEDDEAEETKADKKVPEVKEEDEEDGEADAVKKDTAETQEKVGDKPAEKKEEELAQQPVVPEKEPQQPEAAPSPTSEELNAQYEKFFTDSVEVLSEKVYKLDAETAEKLDTSPSEVIPKLAATLHMQVLTAAVTQIANMLPSAMAMQGERQTVAQQREQKFYEKFPALKEHSTTVQRLAAAYRQTNPKADFDTAVSEIGTMAMVALRLPLEASPQKEPLAAKPVIPTSGKGGATPPPPQPDKTVWDELIEEED